MNIFRDVGANPMFELIIVFTVLVQYLIVQYGGDFTRTEPLSLEEWKVTGLLGRPADLACMSPIIPWCVCVLDC